MSHGKLRKATNCLNCGAEVQGRFCHVCGQENIEPAETLWGLITHFVYDITHFDGKFFSTLRYLLFRPAFLSIEYVRGRRHSYLHPIRMYVFTSALFFFVFFATKPAQIDDSSPEVTEYMARRSQLIQRLSLATDTAQQRLLSDSLNKAEAVLIVMEEIGIVKYDSTISKERRLQLEPLVQKRRPRVSLGASADGLTKQQYDSLQQSLPEARRDGSIQRWLKEKTIQLNAKFQYQSGGVVKVLIDKFLHSLPIMMFISLPLVAALIALLYWSSKERTYVHIGILVIHNYVAVYVFTLVTILFSWLAGFFWSDFFGVLAVILFFYSIFYQYKALRNFFGQRRLKTMLKYLVLLFFSFILFVFLSIIFVINSLLQV
ncbi:MAG: DUF3667 domain-containing protein [Chitinophagaceae bacterium]|nr:DUF3667 domain-containing protein [Chitinophagaceae bacterium]